MIFNSIINKKFRFICLISFCVLIALPAFSQVQKPKKVRQLIDVTLKVTEENGNPIPNANVVVGEGIIHAVTDQSGTVSFKGYPDDLVTVTASAFEKNVVPVATLIQNNTVKLLKAKIQMTSDDNIQLPFMMVKKRNLTGPEMVLPGSVFEKYPSVDIRNSLSGLISGWDIREMEGSPGMTSMEGQQDLNGIGNAMNATNKFSGMPLVMVDGVITELQEAPMDPAEIESATLVKGILGTTMFGPQATGGVLYIKTKFGVKNEKMLHVDAEFGTSTIDRMPGWVNGNDYVSLNNLARVNSGLTEKYDAAAIDGYAQNDPLNIKYPNVNWKDMILRDTKPMTKVNMSSSGGNEGVQYFSYLGYASEGDIYKEGSVSDYNRINTRQNVNVKLNDQIDVKFSFYGNMSFRRSPNYGYDSDFTSEDSGSNPVLGLTEFPMDFRYGTPPATVLNDLNTLPGIMFPVKVTEPGTGVEAFGVSSQSAYTSNPLGGLTKQGYYTDQSRTGASNLSLNWDLGNVVKGLNSSTFLGFNIHNLTRIGKANDYLAYYYGTSPKTGVDTLFKSSAHNVVTQSANAKLMDYYFQRYSFYQTFNYERTFGDHSLQSSLTFNAVKAFINGVEEPQRNEGVVLSAMYAFKDKYSLQGVLNYAGNSSFSNSQKWGLFPAIGANWIVSDESFMSNVKFMNFLKLRAQYGVVGDETYMSPLRYVDRWSQNTSGTNFGPASTLQWFGSTTDANVPRTSPQWVGNPDLTWPKRKEFTAGFDALFMQQKLALDMTYWNIVNDGGLLQINNILAYTAGLQGARPWYNYTRTRYNMVTADLHFTDKVGEFSYTVGVNATTSKGTREKYDEPAYRNDYQKRTGKASDAIFGMNQIGTFSASDFDANGNFVSGQPIPLYDATLKPGDLKYEDVNGDNFVDDLDQKMIGNSSPRLYYGINVDFRYKGFELFVLGNGRAFYNVALTNTYYQNGWGDNNYSNFVKNNVDPATGIGTNYPRLTYYKVNNNFVLSNYWLAKGDFFKIQNVELSYTIPAKMLQFMGGRAVKIYFRGANLMTFSKLKDVDPETMSGTGSSSTAAGVTNYPLYRTLSGGVKFNF